MCITLLTTAHPVYPFILANNRDEFLERPTAPAEWWAPPNTHILGGRDLQRRERGTWLGITKQGRLANLTNFRDEDVEVAKDKSRGALVNAYLTLALDARQDDEAFVSHLVDDIGIHDVGGFTLLFGRLRAPKNGLYPGLAAMSNRTSSTEGATRICTGSGETHGLSNSHYGDSSWPKVVQGEQLMKQAISLAVDRGDGKETLINSLFDVLSVDTLPRPQPGEDFQTYTTQLRNSILIPPVGGSSVKTQPADQLASAEGTNSSHHGTIKVGHGVYGTLEQTVILVDTRGHVIFVERMLSEEDGRFPTSEQEYQRFEFEIDGWDS